MTYDKHIRGGAVLTKQQKVCFLGGVINFDDYFLKGWLCSILCLRIGVRLFL